MKLLDRAWDPQGEEFVFVYQFCALAVASVKRLKSSAVQTITASTKGFFTEEGRFIRSRGGMETTEGGLRRGRGDNTITHS